MYRMRGRDLLSFDPAANHSSYNAVTHVNPVSEWKEKHYTVHITATFYFSYHQVNYTYLHLTKYAFIWSI